MNSIASVHDVADLLGAIAWPIVAVVAVVWLRRPVGLLLQRIAVGARKLSVGSFTVELGEEGSASTGGIAAIRESAAAYELSSSYTSGLAAELKDSQPMPFALIDLGDGTRWLSSRLYLFAALLSRFRGLQALIFVESSEGVAGRFVGLARADQLTAALAAAQPWLEVDLAAAVEGVLTPYVGGGPAPPPDQGFVGEQVAQAFVLRIQQQPGAPPPPGQPMPDPAGVPEGWTLLTGRQQETILEHGIWLNATLLSGLLGAALDQFAYVVDDGAVDAQQLATEVLRHTNRDYVVLVDRQNRFKRTLIERRLALEQVAAQAVDAPLAA